MGIKGKGEGKGQGTIEVEDAANKKFKHKKKEKKEGILSRGQKQREKRRQAKEKNQAHEVRKDVYEKKMQKEREDKSVKMAANRDLANNRKRRFEPDAGPAEKKNARQRPGEMSDDFELRAMERFRAGKR